MLNPYHHFTVPSDQLWYPITEQISAHRPADAFEAGHKTYMVQTRSASDSTPAVYSASFLLKVLQPRAAIIATRDILQLLSQVILHMYKSGVYPCCLQPSCSSLHYGLFYQSSFL